MRKLLTKDQRNNWFLFLSMKLGEPKGFKPAIWKTPNGGLVSLSDQFITTDDKADSWLEQFEDTRASVLAEELKALGHKDLAQAMLDPFSKDPDVEYELARKNGDARYGSPCDHEMGPGNRCKKCGRKLFRVKKGLYGPAPIKPWFK